MLLGFPWWQGSDEDFIRVTIGFRLGLGLGLELGSRVGFGFDFLFKILRFGQISTTYSRFLEFSICSNDTYFLVCKKWKKKTQGHIFISLTTSNWSILR